MKLLREVLKSGTLKSISAALALVMTLTFAGGVSANLRVRADNEETTETTEATSEAPVTEETPDLGESGEAGTEAGAEAEPAKPVTGVEGFVTRFYNVALDREPETDGFNYWVDGLNSHSLTGVGLAAGFVYSEEFQGKNLDDASYVTYMYKMFFDREPDEEGISHWTDILGKSDKNEGRKTVFMGFVNSAEFVELCANYGITRGYFFGVASPAKESASYLFVERLYEVVLKRSLDDSGRDYWVLQLINGETTGIALANDIFTSDEYVKSATSDSDYVKDLYSTFLDREPDEGGLSHWTQMLKDGKSRTEVLNGIGVSEEYTAICERFGITRGDAIKTNNGFVVCIDPGHTGKVAPGLVPLGPGSSDMKAADASGTTGRWSNVPEYVLTLQVAMELKAELEARGYTVVMTREDSNDALDIIKRAEIANEGNADIFVRLHADALDTSSASGCTAVCISPSNPWHSEVYADSRLLSDCIRNAYSAATGIKNRGVYEWDTMAGNNWSTIPCVLFEMGFMTNQGDDLYMTNPANQVTMAQGIADGIDEYFAQK